MFCFPWSPHSVVVDDDVLLVLGASHGLLQPLQHGAVARVLHIVLRLGQQQLPWRCVQVLITPVLSVTLRWTNVLSALIGQRKRMPEFHSA